MKYSGYIVLVIMVFLAIGCGTKDPLKSSTDGDGVLNIMPLRVGNSWTYDFKVFQPNNPTPIYAFDWTLKIVSTQVINDTTWYLGYHILTDGIEVDTLDYYYTNLANGLWVRESLASTPYFRVKYPADQGEVFEAFNELYGIVSAVSVISTATSVTVPHGTFQCYNYRMIPSSTFQIDDYFRPGLGWVKSEWRVYDASAGWYTNLLIELKGTNL